MKPVNSFCPHISVTTLAVHCEFPNMAIVKCVHCGLVFADPLPQTDELEHYYRSQYRAKQSMTEDLFAAAESYAEYQVAFVERYAPEVFGTLGSSALDIGSGNGTLVYALEQRGFNATGIEPDAHLSEKSMQRYQVNVSHGTIENLDASQSFHLVSLSHVLEHLPNPVDSLKRISAVLADDGVVFIEVPNDNVQTVRAQSKVLHKTGSHLYFFTPETLRLIVNEAGYDMVAISTCGMSVTSTLRYWAIKGRFNFLQKYISNRDNLLRHYLTRVLPKPHGKNNLAKKCYPLDGIEQGIVIRCILRREIA